ncbi:MAG: DUF1822 family protein [Cyanosarcina radialis HA8281-LM2]|jgi:hypothetical protein|nr:DUF1822 family protein [Cyanosarcina radialis HA8281-LM2]
MNLTSSQAITVLLDKHAHRYARQFATEQASVEKGKQVYLNTLAVCAVQTYLKWLSIPTALDRSDCWHPGLRATFNAADLVLPQIGKLECRPIIGGDRVLILPPEAIDNRIGYVAVEFQEELDRVQLLGFLKPSTIINPLEPIPLDRLSDLDALIETLDRCRNKINLRQWLNGIFESEWQPLEVLLATHGKAFRTGANLSEVSQQRGKLIRWKIAGETQTTILAIKLKDKSSQIVDISLGIYPLLETESSLATNLIADEQIDSLTPKLQITVLDELGNTCMSAQTQNTNQWIKLEFSCQFEETFTVQINWGETIITEQFVV